MIFLNKKSNRNTATISNFTNISYQKHNIKRLAHLDSLNFSLKNKKVLEIGSGIGDHTYYYLIKGANITSTDGRPELVDIIQERFGNECFVLNVEEELDKLKNLPKYDIIHCYGLLYHIINPKEFLATIKNKTELFLLETCVSHDFRIDGPHLVDEDTSNITQAISGKGCRPTRKWIYEQLQKSFKYVYFPISQPDHIEFPKNWEKPIEDREALIRAIFIASENELQNNLLTSQIPSNYI